MKIDLSFLQELDLNSSFLKELIPNLWIMDDHRWAFFVWEQYSFKKAKRSTYKLVHIDYHWDGINDFTSPESQERLKSVCNIKEIQGIVADNKSIRKDSFIAPAIIRETINEVHFYCVQDWTERGLDDYLLKTYKAKQFIHGSIEQLVKKVKLDEVLLDIDIDIFNDSDNFLVENIWPDKKILQFIKMCKPLIENAFVITVALSFGYSGTGETHRRLADKVISEILSIRGH